MKVKEYITIQEMAEIKGVSPQSIYQKIKREQDQKIKTYQVKKIGKLHLIRDC